MRGGMGLGDGATGHCFCRGRIQKTCNYQLISNLHIRGIPFPQNINIHTQKHLPTYPIQPTPHHFPENLFASACGAPPPPPLLPSPLPPPPSPTLPPPSAASSSLSSPSISSPASGLFPVKYLHQRGEKRHTHTHVCVRMQYEKLFCRINFIGHSIQINSNPAYDMMRPRAY
jgi:hypothetical protein